MPCDERGLTARQRPLASAGDCCALQAGDARYLAGADGCQRGARSSRCSASLLMYSALALPNLKVVAVTKSSDSHAARCRCGQVRFAISGTPIMHVACYCTSCRTAGHQFEQMPGSAPVVADDGGTDFVLYRKDRVLQAAGADLLSEHRLQPDSPTRRMIATCCNTPLLLEFTKGHWLSFYRNCLPEMIPPLELRIMTKDKPAAVTLPDDLPNYATHSGKFMRKLLF